MFFSMLRRVFTVVCAIAGLCVIFGSPGSAETISDYNRLLDSTASGLNQAIRIERAHPGAAQSLLDRLADSVPGRMAVVTSGGAIDVDLSQLKSDLQQFKRVKGKDRVAGLTNLNGRIRLMRSVTTGVSPAASGDHAKADAELKKVLAGGEYQPSRTEAFQKWLMRQIGKLLGQGSVPPAVGAIIGWIVLILLIVALIVLLVFIAMRVIAYYSVTKPKTNGSAAPHYVRKKAPSVASALEIAEKHAAEGQYREAYRSAYLAAILTLDRAKLVKYVDGTTNWEYLRALSRQPNEEPTRVFGEMTSSFDELIYGKRSVSDGDYRACVAKYRSLEEVVR